MLYFKIIDGEEFVSIGTSLNLCRYEKRKGLSPFMLICDIKEAQYIIVNDNYYHASWMRNESVEGLYPTVNIIEIDEEEYNILSKAMENDEDIETDTTGINNIDEDISTSTETDEVDVNEVITLDFVKDKKIKEMNSNCYDTIINGFDVVLSDGNSYHFSLTIQDQINLMDVSTLISEGETVISYHADGESFKFYSVEDITEILNSSIKFKTYQRTYFNSLKKYIESLDDISTVSSIFYGIEIPEEFQSDVLKTLV